MLELKLLRSAARRAAPGRPAVVQASVVAPAPVEKPVEAAVVAPEPAVVEPVAEAIVETAPVPQQPLPPAAATVAAGPTPVVETAPPVVEAPVVPPATALSEMRELEGRIAARLAQQEQSVTDIANQVLLALKAQAAAPAPVAQDPLRPVASEDSGIVRLEKTINLIAEKLSRMDVVLGSAIERLQKLEQNLESFDADAAELRDSVTRDIRNFERALKAHSTAIESTRTAMGQTDDLVERVVEALDTLQAMFIAGPEQQHPLAS
jgi:hypothetical protein